ncbi:Crp/Fnr family transcriptional regulator [Actinomadura sp. NBRC 104412]|uniref:Crp/Fnr family transcriptional regulator n=1 Tax=Actinomadura sp. NBRC 104412 TaxID=3032203 RepID=UPI0024A57448|nr:Crp/Fnr family transcriptional regulator [Actinomadura sp. NBRC 104412]GLZ08914.1 Crp/Fnr family transcriptional regulator [Actinomadura sp. NBRC 104412]
MTALEPGSFYAELTPEERRDLESRGRYRDLERGEVLFREGEESTWVAVLLTGRVKAYSDRLDGGEALLDVRGPGALLGEVAAIDGLPRSATVATLEPARLLAITAEEFMSFLGAHGRVSVLIMKMLCRRWREADRRRLEFGMFDATGRVAQRLVELAERFGVPYEQGGGRAATRPNGPTRPPRPGDAKPDGTSVRITLHLTQEELAGWVGASREAVSKALGTLRRHGWIETGRRRVIVHDLQALRRHAR